jgi:hypothetical protein
MTDTMTAGAKLLHGIVLAAGETVAAVRSGNQGEALPKQYVNLIGRRSMLDHTAQGRSENQEGHYGAN